MKVIILLLGLCRLPLGAIAVVQHGFSEGAAVTSLSVTLNGVKAGHLLWVATAFQSTQSVSMISDGTNTYTQSSCSPQTNSGTAKIASYYVPSSASGNTTVTVTYTASVNVAFLEFAEISGIKTASPQDGCVAANSSSTTPSAGSFTTAVPSEILLGLLGNATNGTGASTATGSMTLLDASTVTSLYRGAAEYRIVTSTGTYSDGWSTSAATSAALLTSFEASGIHHRVTSQ